MKKFICIDVGGTSIKYGLSNEIGEFTHKGSMDTEALEKGGPGILEKIKTISKKYIANNDIEGICISTAGMVDPKEGKVVYYSLDDEHISKIVKKGREHIEEL